MLLLKPHRGRVVAVAFAPDGRTVASAAHDGLTTFLWESATGARRGAVPTAARVAAFTPTGRHLVLASRFGVVSVWDAANGRVVADMREAGGAACRAKALAVTADGRVLVATDVWTEGLARHHRVTGWPSAKGGAPMVWAFGDEAGPRALAPDGGRLAVAVGQVVLVYELRPDPGFRTPARRLTADETVSALTFAPDGTRLAVGFGAGVGVWDAATGRPVHTFDGHKRTVAALAFSPDGRLLLTGGRDGVVKLWDLPAGRERVTYDWGVGPVAAVAVAPDGLRAAVGGEGPVVLFDVE